MEPKCACCIKFRTKHDISHNLGTNWVPFTSQKTCFQTISRFAPPKKNPLTQAEADTERNISVIDSVVHMVLKQSSVKDNV